MNIPVIKTDPKLPHHYIIGVVMRPLNDSYKPGKLDLKYFLYFTNDDVENVKRAIMMEQDQIYKLNTTEALISCECYELVESISKMKLAITANMGTLHHFSSEEKFEEEYFEQLIEISNTSEYGRKLLHDSRIRT